MSLPPRVGPCFNAEYNPDCFHFLPTAYWMRGEYEDGSPAGVAIVFAWTWISLSWHWE